MATDLGDHIMRNLGIVVLGAALGGCASSAADIAPAFDKDDRLRAHIPLRGVSARRSAMWEVFDISADEARWYERRELSDRMLNLLAPVTTV